MRVRYAKRGRLRFASHRDFSRAFERAVARAGIPVAYSSGFHPHPRISYAGAAPTGAASQAEYLEIALAAEVDGDQVRSLLHRALPEGLDVLQVVPATGESLPDRLEASRWRTTLPGVAVGELREAVAGFEAATKVQVERMTKKGLRRFDVRAAVLGLETSCGSGTMGRCAILEMVLRHGNPSVRPDDVLAGLRSQAGLWTDVAPLHERLAQGPWDAQAGSVGDPLAPDRDTA